MGMSSHDGAEGPAGRDRAGRDRVGRDHAGHSLVGHRVLITGATGPRIGSGIADALHAAGALLAIHGPTVDAVDATVARYPGSVGVVGDVAVDDDVARVVDEASSQLGRLTGLVNNAGVGLKRPVEDVTADQFDTVVDTDLRGVWQLTRAFVNQRNVEEPAAIVNVSSVHATGTMPEFGIYAAAKAGVEGLTRGCAVDLGPLGIRCNAIAPGFVPANPSLAPEGPAAPTSPSASRHAREEQVLDRVIEPIDCGWAVRFLLSEESRCITGQVLTVDAGLTTRLYNTPTSARALGHPIRGTGPGGAEDITGTALVTGTEQPGKRS